VSLDQWVAACLVPLAVWILLSGLDDLFIDLAFLFTGRKQFPWPAESELDEASERRIAIVVPLWREDGVIGQMLEHNLAAIRYTNYDIFVGLYPNDRPTIEAVARVAAGSPRVHLAISSHPGPTSKGDCLNSAYTEMADYEADDGRPFDLVVTHDAEDLIHPDALRLVNWFSRTHEMIQVPVLPLRTGIGEFTHGLYCDEFADYQLKHIPVRRRLRGFLPSNGVGTGFAREALEALREKPGGLIFNPDCLTEDYEIGYSLHELGYRQVFVPVRFDASGPVATREYFPRSFRAAVRQRSRWVAGIALQGWERHGWRAPWRQRYWLWRDRKSLVGNLLTPLANLISVYGATTYVWAAHTGQVWPLGALIPPFVGEASVAALWISAIQVGGRMAASARVYGWRFASGAPLRMFWANLVNWTATVAALRQFVSARHSRRALAWRKTDHIYPERGTEEV
jgi:bacteriophage N4 adsorption protein B